jgi:hypothetical protein
MGLKSQLVKLIEAVIPDNSINKSDGVINYGFRNLLPQELLKVVSDSGTATSCMSQLSAFIQADGFTKENENLKKVNPDQTAKDLLAEASYYQAMFNGFAFHILFALDGSVGEVTLLPFQKVRKTDDENFVYNETLGNKEFKKEKNIKYKAFNPNLTPEERLKQIKTDIKTHGTQRGELLYSYTLSPYSQHYPVPQYYAGLDDIRSDAGLMRLEFRNINRGFRPNVIIATVGDIDDKQIDSTTGLTDSQQFDKNLLAFTGEDAATVLHLQSPTKEGLPEVTQFPLAELLDGVDKATDRVARKVCRHIGVPPVLIGLSMPEGLGNTQAIANNMKLFNHSIVNDQNLLSSAFKMMFPKDAAGNPLTWTITTLNLVDYIPAEVLAVLTNDEKRIIGGFDALPKTDTGGGVSLAETLGVGGTQSLQSVLTDAVLTPQQKVQILIILFNLAEDKANLMVYGGQPPAPPTPPQ